MIAPGIEGIHGVELANAMLLSTWLDDWVDIPVDETLYFEKLQEQIGSSKNLKDNTGSSKLSVEGTF